MSSANVSRDADADPYKLVEDRAGTGRVSWQDRVFADVTYRIKRFQGMSRSGLPVPGLHRIEGSIDFGAVAAPAELADKEVLLQMEDGRSLRVTLAGTDGRVFAEGHGPSRCTCC